MTTGDGITRKEALVAAGAVGAVGAGAVGVAGVLGLLSGEEAAEGALVARHVAGALPLTDPGAPAWDDAPETVVPLQPQRVAPPFLDTAGVAELRVRALHNGKAVAFRLAWEDGSIDDLDSVRRYHDAVAIMLPATPGADPPITMGSPERPVHILQWRATWQRDLAGKSGVDQIFPRVEHDVMPDDVLPPETAALYWVGRAAGNPLSQSERTTAVEQIVAEGFGTTTHVRDDSAVGRGVHDGSGWSVAIGLPAAREGIGTPLEPGRQWQTAFAVWLGDQQNRGGRKHYANWIPFQLELP
jgi:hypothetical protein